MDKRMFVTDADTDVCFVCGREFKVSELVSLTRNPGQGQADTRRYCPEDFGRVGLMELFGLQGGRLPREPRYEELFGPNDEEE